MLTLIRRQGSTNYKRQKVKYGESGVAANKIIIGEADLVLRTPWKSSANWQNCIHPFLDSRAEICSKIRNRNRPNPKSLFFATT